MSIFASAGILLYRFVSGADDKSSATGFDFGWLVLLASAEFPVGRIWLWAKGGEINEARWSDRFLIDKVL